MKTFIKKSAYGLLLAALCAIFLTSCDPSVYHFKQEELQPIVEKVKLIDYQNGTPKKIKKNEEILPFDFEKEEVLETLDNSKIDEFLQELSKFSILIVPGVDSTNGKSLKITLKEGEFIIFSVVESEGFTCGFVAVYNADGTVKKYIGRVDGKVERYFELIEKYFGEVE